MTETANDIESRMHPCHLADLRKSGLLDKTISEAGIKSVRPEDINKIFGYETFAMSCYEIPYGDGYSRYKIFYSETNKINPKTKKPRPKYLQKKGSGNHLYIPPKVKSILNDASIPLHIVEGEKKCLKGIQEGLNCIGLSGLWNWTNKKKFDIEDKKNWCIGGKEGWKELLPEFKFINFTGRTVYIVPDSDWTKPGKHGYPTNLKQAVCEFTGKIKERGGEVLIIELPQEGEGKTGLDDYLCQHTIEEFQKLTCKSFDNFDDFDNSLRDIFENTIPEYSFPFEIFPERFQTVIGNYSTGLSVEPEIIAHIMLVLLSGAVGSSIKMESKPSHTEPLFLWGVLIQPSGLGKTHAINALIKPIENKQAATYQKYQEDLKKYDEYQRQLKESKKGSSKDKSNNIKVKFDGIIDMDRPIFRQYIANDSTIEANADIFINQPRGVILHLDELSSLPLGFGRYKKSEGADKQHYLEIWNANPITINRVTTGVKYVPNTGLAIIGGIQTQIITKIFSDTDIYSGLLPRFLPVLIDSKLPYSDKTIDENDKDYWNDIIDRCYGVKLDIDNKTGMVKPCTIRLSNEAFNLYALFRNEYDQLLELLPEKTRTFIPKLQTYCLRFTGILHVLKTFDANNNIGANTVIDTETMTNAVKLTRYYTYQVDKLIRLYSPQEELKPYHIRVIKTILKLKNEVSGGRLYISRITETYNSGLPEHLILKGIHIGNILRKELKLNTDTSHDAYLTWEDEKLNKYFKRVSKVSKLSNKMDADKPYKQNKPDDYGLVCQSKNELDREDFLNVEYFEVVENEKV